MLWYHAPQIYPADIDKCQTRVGACFHVENEEYIICFDGRCGNAASRVIRRLNKRKKRKILFLSHPHYDHYYGIEKDIDTYGDAEWLICPDPASYNRNYSDEVKGNIAALERIIKKAKAKNIAVAYANNGDEFSFGDIEFTVYRDQPSSARNSETYINQGSLCAWFANSSLLYTADTGAYCAKKYGLKPKVITGLHHGNWLESEGWQYLKSVGCEFYWDDDYSTVTTDFLKTGRGNALKAKFKVFNLHGDLNILVFDGKANIYKGGKAYSYSCPYDGEFTLKGATLEMVKRVLNGTAGASDARITYLIERGYNPGSVQGWVNTFYKLIKG